MRVLILGGTAFLGRAVARAAASAGHDVTCAARGEAGPLADGVRFIKIDRADPAGLAPLDGERFDTVVDVARDPGYVRRAVAALRERAGHWTFVSTGNVYAEFATVGADATAPLREPTPPDVDLGTPETYGEAKVACEQTVGVDAFICRAGLIVGPEDPSGRFTYWPVRLARGGEVLVPGTPGDAVQWVDVRDLADWIVRAGESGLTGAYDGVGPARPRGEFLAGIAGALDADVKLTWVDDAFLVGREVPAWSGPGSLPMWVGGDPDWAGFMARDTSAALAAGLRPRELGATAVDTLAWVQAHDGTVTGATAAEEADLLRAWHISRTSAARPGQG